MRLLIEDGAQMTGNLILQLRGDRLTDSMVPSDLTDLIWTHPTLSFDFPECAMLGEIFRAPFRS